MKRITITRLSQLSDLSSFSAKASFSLNVTALRGYRNYSVEIVFVTDFHF